MTVFTVLPARTGYTGCRPDDSIPLFSVGYAARKARSRAGRRIAITTGSRPHCYRCRSFKINQKYWEIYNYGLVSTEIQDGSFRIAKERCARNLPNNDVSHVRGLDLAGADHFQPARRHQVALYFEVRWLISARSESFAVRFAFGLTATQTECL